MAAGHARAGILAVAAATMLLLSTACSSTSDADEAKEQALAEQLVDSAHAAGVAPRLTVDVAESLYGTDAPSVCETFDDGLSTAEQNLLLGNPAQGRRKTITDDAVTYGRVVVETYCPDNLDEYDDAVADLDPYRDERPMSTIDGAVPVTGEPDDEGTGGIRSVATMAWPALGMLMVASVGSIAQLSDSASFGLGAVTVYLLPALLFLLPVGLVSAELATANRGGIFVWVKDAFGDRTGFQATWFVFMNSVTLYPSLLSFGAAALGHRGRATGPGRPTGPTWAPSSWWCSGWPRSSSAAA